MSISLRSYEISTDFSRVSDFLDKAYLPCNRDGNWFQPTWEYMHTHPCLDESALGQIGIWEEDGRIVGVAHYESQLGEAFFEVRAGYAHLKPWMLAYAETHLAGHREDGQRLLSVYINDFDRDFEALALSFGYRRNETLDRPMSRLSIDLSYQPDLSLPDGFRVASLAQENDLFKVQRVLWRGFNHPGEPPADEIDGEVKMLSGPHFRKDLKMLVIAPGGDYVAFCGLWYDAHNHLAYVEPVATDPDFRRMGLARATLTEGLRRCAVLGAKEAYVGSDLEFYRSLGFRKVFTGQAFSWPG